MLSMLKTDNGPFRSISIRIRGYNPDRLETFLFYSFCLFWYRYWLLLAGEDVRFSFRVLTNLPNTPATAELFKSTWYTFLHCKIIWATDRGLLKKSVSTSLFVEAVVSGRLLFLWRTLKSVFSLMLNANRSSSSGYLPKAMASALMVWRLAACFPVSTLEIWLMSMLEIAANCSCDQSFSSRNFLTCLPKAIWNSLSLFFTQTRWAKGTVSLLSNLYIK